MRKVLLCLLALSALGRVAFADTCTGTTTVQSSGSTQVLAAGDVQGGRHYLLIQNLGSPAVFCSIGADATTSSGYYIQQYGSLLMEGFMAPNGVVISVPSAAVNCIAASTTASVTVCDY